MKNWSIGRKLFAGVGALLVLTALACGLALRTLATLQGNLEEASGPIGTRLSLAAGMVAAAHEAWAAEEGAIVSAFAHNRKQGEQFRERQQAALEKLSAATAELRLLLASEENRLVLDQTREGLEAWKRNADKVLELARNGQPGRAQDASWKGSRPAYESVLGASEKVRQLNLGLMAGRRQEGAAQYAAARWMLLAAILAALAVGGTVVWAVRGVNGVLRRAVMELGEGGEQIASASGQVATTSRSLSQGSSEQAASLEQISASMEEMTAMAKRNSENSEEASRMMLETARQVERSNQALREMMESMNGIKSSSEKVAKIIKTIDEIAFQTNILALNAAVEAARAGEAGMGFAVVADEVRSLAQRSAVAAKDTAGLIEEAIQNSNQGAARLDQVAAAIRAITDSSGKVTNLIEEVSESSKQQTTGIDQTTAAVAQVSRVTQSTAAAAEESASASQQLSAHSSGMRERVDALRGLVEGAGSASAPPLSGLRAAPSAAAAGPAGTRPAGDPFPMETVETADFRSF